MPLRASATLTVLGESVLYKHTLQHRFYNKKDTYNNTHNFISLCHSFCVSGCIPNCAHSTIQLQKHFKMLFNHMTLAI